LLIFERATQYATISSSIPTVSALIDQG
jgi:hypothetical protein